MRGHSTTRFKNIQTVVTQYYEADVNKEHVIRGNAAVIKCLIPSFVADFVEVISWHTDEEENFFPSTAYGSFGHHTMCVCTGHLARFTTSPHTSPSFPHTHTHTSYFVLIPGPA